ncbi:shikimate dehydrogenase [Deinococcus radiophilus]|uniref:shikimate dehydrogenase n=1 Tax=Deinococcus radiophilus TaxID=32062 RepID=UPI001E555CC5|nr:shikimate dehydrogenase [Deinococcus radiophilus]UFA51114.1 shikimate dehydrogenase [Deinococcus radiophilus]
MSRADSFPPVIGLLGAPPAAAQALSRLGFQALSLPVGNLGGSLLACQTLGIGGVLVHSTFEEAAFAATESDEAARRAGKVDAIALPTGALAGQVLGTYTLTEALSDAVAATHYSARGATALMIGHGPDLAAVLPLTRLGFSQVGFVADHLPAAERLSREVPAGTATYALSRRDSALQTLAERADLIVVAGGSVPPGVLQPYHTLLDLTGRVPAGSATQLQLDELPGLRLSQQLLHVTGQRLSPAALSELAQAMQMAR